MGRTRHSCRLGNHDGAGRRHRTATSRRLSRLPSDAEAELAVWAFIVGCRGDDTHGRLVAHLTASSARWAPTASLLLANLAHRYVEDTDWEFSEFAHYDLGQAVAHLTLQARALGLFVRQFRAFDRQALAAEFAVPTHWEVTTMAAIGRVPDGITQESQRAARDRRALDELVHAPLLGEHHA